MHRFSASGAEDVEILIVDDGSTDKTAEIADEYAEKYPTIVKAIHKENGGHGSGVNTGIEKASGLFFKVVDSDDWVLDTRIRRFWRPFACLRAEMRSWTC